MGFLEDKKEEKEKELSENIKREIVQFKMELLRKIPFYGDVAMKLAIVEDDSIPTAATNGRKIMYNKHFMSNLTKGEQNFVVMHEIMHVLLIHFKRGKERDPELWNIACDYVVNGILERLRITMNNNKIPFEHPKNGCYLNFYGGKSVEFFYNQLVSDNEEYLKNKKKKILVRRFYGSNLTPFPMQNVPEDIIVEIDSSMTPQEAEQLEKQIINIVRDAARKNRGNMGSYFVPAACLALVESKKLPWRNLLMEYLEEDLSEESSYLTPERKYIHMDLIVPGLERNNEVLGEIWVFIDSSGSISSDAMNQFLTQIYRIAKEFQCVTNIAYWDTTVTDVYEKVAKKEDILNCVPHHSGGTDINCVYDYIQERKLKPSVMIILTDGYFGRVNDKKFQKKLKPKTILVLTENNGMMKDEFYDVGKIASL